MVIPEHTEVTDADGSHEGTDHLVELACRRSQNAPERRVSHVEKRFYRRLRTGPGKGMRGRYALMLLTPPGLPVVRSYLTRQGTGGREGLRRGTDNGAIEKIPGTGTLRYSGTQQHHVARRC